MPPPTEQHILPRIECKTTIDDDGLGKMIGVQDLVSEVYSPTAAGEALTRKFNTVNVLKKL